MYACKIVVTLFRFHKCFKNFLFTSAVILKATSGNSPRGRGLSVIVTKSHVTCAYISILEAYPEGGKVG